MGKKKKKNYRVEGHSAVKLLLKKISKAEQKISDLNQQVTDLDIPSLQGGLRERRIQETVDRAGTKDVKKAEDKLKAAQTKRDDLKDEISIASEALERLQAELRDARNKAISEISLAATKERNKLFDDCCETLDKLAGQLQAVSDFETKVNTGSDVNIGYWGLPRRMLKSDGQFRRVVNYALKRGFKILTPDR